jgi:hypothetical protein
MPMSEMLGFVPNPDLRAISAIHKPHMLSSTQLERKTWILSASRTKRWISLPIFDLTEQSGVQMKCLLLPDIACQYQSLPLNRSWRLTQNIVSHSRDATNLVDNATRNLFEKLKRHMGELGGHKIGGVDRSQSWGRSLDVSLSIIGYIVVI